MRPARGADPEHRATLRRRATALARSKGVAQATAGAAHVVFVLGGERYAVDARTVLEVAPLRSFTPLPASAAPLHGLTYWRGHVITILDLRAMLGVRVRGVADLARAVVVDNGQEPFAFLVEATAGVARVDSAALLPLPAGEGTRSGLVAGATLEGMLVLDSPELLRLANPRPASPTIQGGTR